MKAFLATILLIVSVGTAGTASAADFPMPTGPMLTKAEIQQDGTVTIDGSINWVDCPGFCNWTVFVTVQPSLPSYACTNGQMFAGDPNIRTLWKSTGPAGANGTVPLSASGLINPSPMITDLRACLHVMTTIPAPPKSWSTSGVYVTKAAPPSKPPVKKKTKAQKRKAAIAKCNKKYKGKSKSKKKKRNACIKKAKKKYR